MSFNKIEALRRADEHVSRGEITGAIAIHRMIVQADPYDLKTINSLGDLYLRAGRIKDAIEDFTSIADAHLGAGSGIKAAYLLKKALDLDASNSGVLMKLGEIYLREGMTQKAHDEFIKAGALFAREGQFTSALQAYHRALNSRPDSPQAKAAIAAMQQEAADDRSTDKAGTPVDASPHEPRNVAPAFALHSAIDEGFIIKELTKAEMMAGYGQVDQAIDLLRRLVSHSPDNLDVHVKLKDIYLRNEMLDEAGQECFELARIHEIRGESARAREYMIRAGRLAASSGQLINSHQLSQSADREATFEPQQGSPPADFSGATSVDNSVVPAEYLVQRTEHSEAAVPEPEGIKSKPSVVAPSPNLAPEPPRPRVGKPLSKDPLPTGVITLPREAPLPSDRVPPMSLRVAERRFNTNPLEDAATKHSLTGADVVTASPAGLALAEAARASIGETALRRPKLLYAASIALVSAAALVVGALKGTAIYEARLDTAYADLTRASVETVPVPPSLPSQDDLAPRAQSDAINVEPPPTQVVTPFESRSEEPSTAARAASVEPERPTPISVAAEQIKPTRKNAAPPPMTALTDQRPGDGSLPNGLPTGVSQANVPAPTPPSSPASPQKPVIVSGHAIKRVQPSYPSIARTARQEGTVVVEVNVNEQGDVVSARARSGPATLRGAAENAARLWKFKPSTRDGKPMMTVTTINFAFKL